MTYVIAIADLFNNTNQIFVVIDEDNKELSVMKQAYIQFMTNLNNTEDAKEYLKSVNIKSVEQFQYELTQQELLITIPIKIA